MNAHCSKHRREGLRECNRSAAGFQVNTRVQYPLYTNLLGSAHHSGPVQIKAVKVQMAVGVNQHRPRPLQVN
jgi:hypothetical protein